MDLESRFHSLIQPIRDLASNWDVDIAESLESYLEELERLRVTIDSSSGKAGDSKADVVNFAEAALLIQGSTAIYSKKVEYLHQLVLQALEVISNKSGNSYSSFSSKDNKDVANKQKNGINNHNSANAILDDERLLFGSDPTFLLLDDVLEEGSNIQTAIDPKTAKDKRRSSGRHSASGDLSRASMVLMHSLLQEDHGGSCLKMSTCHLDASGALLIGGSLALAQMPGLLLGAGSVMDINSSGVNNIFNNDDDALMNDDHDDQVWPGGDDDYDLAYPGAGNPPPVAPIAATREVVLQQPPVLTLLGLKNSNRPNPLALMDPHESSTASKGVLKGRPFKIPTHASNHSKQKLLLRKVEKSESSLLFERILGGELPLTGFTFTAFKDVIKFERAKKFKSNMQKARARDCGVSGQMQEMFIYKEVTGNDDDDYVTGGDINDDVVVSEGAAGHDDDMADVGGFWGTGGDDNDDDGFGAQGYLDNEDKDAVADVRGEAVDFVDDETMPRGPYDANRALARILAEEDELARRVENALNEGFNDSQANTYEALCRKHIESFMRGAEQYRRETQLSRRVADWTRKLEATLKAQEEAPLFDIDVYTGAVMSSMQKAVTSGTSSEPYAKNSVSFDEVVEGKDSSEVSRVFLACLQLVNAGSLSVNHASAEGNFSMQLVSNNNVQSAAKRMDAFMASSAVSGSQLLEM